MKRAKHVLVLTTIVILMLLWLPLSFAAPNEMNFQGRLTNLNGSQVDDGYYIMEFLIYESETGGSYLWWELQEVYVQNSIYNAILGRGTTYHGTLDAALFSGDDRWLEVRINGFDLSPRQKLTSVAYALQAGSTTTGAVTSDMLADDAVTETKVADNSITAAKIVGGSDSGLDSDTLDGHDTTYFATAVHNHNTLYYSKAEVDNLVGNYEDRIAALEAKLNSLSISTDGKELTFSGVNVHVVNGTGTTNSLNGTGNLIIGYNNGSGNNASHNIVVGANNNYRSYGGLVAGSNNRISGPYAVVSGGIGNEASGSQSSVSGGYNNIASGLQASISGGRNNRAIGRQSSISGGGGDVPTEGNLAIGDYSSILGGMANVVGDSSCSIVSDGLGGYEVVCGTADPNYAVGANTTVSGGRLNKASDFVATVSGGEANSASNRGAAVIGGDANNASGYHSTMVGGQGNENSVGYTTKSGEISVEVLEITGQ